MISLLHSACLPNQNNFPEKSQRIFLINIFLVIQQARNSKINSLVVKKRILLNSPCFSLKFSPHNASKLCVSNEDGELLIFDVNDKIDENTIDLLDQFPTQLSHFVNSREKEKNENPRDYRVLKSREKIQAHYNAIFDMDFIHENPNHLITASGDLSCALWDIEKLSAIQYFVGHKKSVRVVKNLPEFPNIFASGSRDGLILLYDTRENSGRALLQNRKTAEIMMLPTENTCFPEGCFMSEKTENLNKSRSKSKHESANSIFFDKNKKNRRKCCYMLEFL